MNMHTPPATVQHEQRRRVARPGDIERDDREEQHGDALQEAADAAQRQLLAEQLQHRRARPQQQAIESLRLTISPNTSKPRAMASRSAHEIEIMP